MTTEELLDRLLVPRPNGSEAFFQVASFIEETLRDFAPEVALHTFEATPYGFQLLFAAVLGLMLGFAAAMAWGRYGLALLLVGASAALLLVETEWLWSPVSGLVSLSEDNIVGVFPGRMGSPTLIFCAHYDTATQIGDHLTWYRWGSAAGAAALAAMSLPLVGLWRSRSGRSLPLAVRVPVAALAVVPFAAFALFFSVGPLVRAPSPGALDNGGSVAVLLQLAERLAARPDNAPTTVKLVFLAAEEERTLGSWHYARMLEADPPLAVVNLEVVGASEKLAYVPEAGFALRRYRSPEPLIRFLEDTALELWGETIRPRKLPGAMFTDGRSFLARGIPALTLMSATESGPRQLHSAHDRRNRLSIPALERTVELLEAVVARVDRAPGLLQLTP